MLILLQEILGLFVSFTLSKNVARRALQARRLVICWIWASMSLFLFWQPLALYLDLLSLRAAHHSLSRPTQAPPEILIVGIDSRSYNETGTPRSSPLPRSVIADALSTIASASPKLLINDAKIPPERGISDADDQKIAAALRATKSTIWTGKNARDAFAATVPSDKLFREAASMELNMDLASVFGYALLLSNQRPGSIYDQIAVSRPLVELAGYQLEAPQMHEFIKFYGPANSLNHISIMELVGEKTPKQIEVLRELIKDKIIFTGYHNLTYPNGDKGKDEYAVPSDSNGMFGVEIHGHILGNLIRREWLRRASPFDEGLRLWLFVFVTSAMVVHTVKMMTMCLVLGLMSATCIATYILFAYYDYWVGGIGMYLVFSAVFLGVSIILRHRRVVAYREYLSQMLGTRWTD